MLKSITGTGSNANEQDVLAVTSAPAPTSDTNVTEPPEVRSDDQGNAELMNLSDDLSSIRTNVALVSDAVISSTVILNEAHGKILLLEAGVFLSLGLSVGVVANCGKTVISSTTHPFMLLLALILSIVVAVTLKRKSSWQAQAGDHAALLERIADAAVTEKKDADNYTENDAIPAKRESTMQKRASLLFEKTLKSLRQIDLDEDTEKRVREASDIPPTTEWPHHPVMVCVNTPVSTNMVVPIHGTGPCPIGKPFKFESELFEGTALLRFRDVTSDDPDGNDNYFRGRNRRFQAVVQGKFKKELLVSDVITGHEFDRPLKRLPRSWIMNAGTSLIRRLSPGVQIDLIQDRPQAMSILAATAQAVNVSTSETEPAITDNVIEENCEKFGGDFVNSTPSLSRRKKLLSIPENASKYKFDTEKVYTFDFYQHLLAVDSYSLDLGFTKISLAPSLDGQPIQFLAKTTDQGYLWSFQIWHTDLVKTD